MGIFETFSKRRKKQERAGKADPLRYDNIPIELRRQIIMIWVDAIGPFDRSGYAEEANSNWTFILKTMTRELGQFNLGNHRMDPFEQCESFLQQASTDGFLDLVELSFKIIDRCVRPLGEYQRNRCGIKVDADDAIAELNQRFLEHGIGYQFTGGELIRMDSQYVHAEVVTAAIALLHEEGFEGASNEFMKAHEHYRKGNSKEAINEALKAFESTMKTICDLRNLSYDKGATAKPLLDILINNGIIPADLTNQLSGLRAALESGVPTIRNRNSGHGQGRHATQVPDHLAALALHLAGANIVFLVEANKAIL
jgi:hypothetical protein